MVGRRDAATQPQKNKRAVLFALIHAYFSVSAGRVYGGTVLALVSVPMIEQDGNGKALVSLKNLTAERYWNARWQREWETKYHDPLVVRPGMV